VLETQSGKTWRNSCSYELQAQNAFEAKILGIFTFNMRQQHFLAGIQCRPAAAATTGGVVNRENTIR